MAALATYELTKDYAVGFWRKRPSRALESLTLDVGAGEVFGFLGPNGAGKTTTIKLLIGLVSPTSGRGEILGRPLGNVSVKRRIGYLPEQPYFYDYLTAEELLGYFAGLFGYAAAERRARVSRLLDEVGIGAERRLQLRTFSKGMLQRVGIAQALINDPELVDLRRADVGSRSARPARGASAHPAAARSRLHGLLQLSRAERRGDAVQPRGDSGERTAGHCADRCRRCWRFRCTAGNSWRPASAPRSRRRSSGGPDGSFGSATADTAWSCRSTRRPIGCWRNSRPPARRSFRSTRSARRSKTSSSNRLRPSRQAPAAIA